MLDIIFHQLYVGRQASIPDEKILRRFTVHFSDPELFALLEHLHEFLVAIRHAYKATESFDLEDAAPAWLAIKILPLYRGDTYKHLVLNIRQFIQSYTQATNESLIEWLDALTRLVQRVMKRRLTQAGHFLRGLSSIPEEKFGASWFLRDKKIYFTWYPGSPDLHDWYDEEMRDGSLSSEDKYTVVRLKDYYLIFETRLRIQPVKFD